MDFEEFDFLAHRREDNIINLRYAYVDEEKEFERKK